MGVLNFPGSLNCQQGGVELDILSLEADIDLQQELNEQALQNVSLGYSDNNGSTSRRKKNKNLSTWKRKSYDFREFGVDARRRGAKHQRRKQNLVDLLGSTNQDCSEIIEEDCLHSNHHLAFFTQLFLDDNKMQAWENFANLSEEKQHDYLVGKSSSRHSCGRRQKGGEETIMGENGFGLIDKKIQDILRTKKLATLGLLEYYEEDMRYCVNEDFPSVLIFNLDSSFDRLLVYAVCQYMDLTSNTIRSKDDNTAIIQIDMPSPDNEWTTPTTTLSEYLKRMRNRR